MVIVYHVAAKRAIKKAPWGKKEMTLDCRISALQSRVISVHSYYLTSLVNLAFYGFDSVSFVPNIFRLF